MKIVKFYFRLLGFLLIALFFISFRESPSNVEKAVSEEGLSNLKNTKEIMDRTAADLHATKWHYGGQKSTSFDSWIFVNAYFDIPDCVDYLTFRDFMIKNGFKTGYSHTGYFCTGDVDVHSIKAQSYHEVWREQKTQSLMCEKISFTISWRKEKNKDYEYCW